MTDYRASFDASITFSNGGDLVVHGFRVDLPGPEADEAQIAALFVASLGLLMTDAVDLANVQIFAEPHKGTRGGPSDHRKESAADGPIIDLTAPSPAPALGAAPAPASSPAPAFDAAPASASASGTAPASAPTSGSAPGNAPGVGVPDAVNPGTRITGELGSLALACTVDLPAVVVRLSGAATRRVDVGALAAFDVRGAAVLVQTGGTGAELTVAAADWLVAQGAALVGTDALSGDGPGGGTKVLLGAGIPVVDGLTGLDLLPPTGARFSAVPLHPEGTSASVRAFARNPV